MQTFCFSLFVKLDLMVVVSFCYNLLSLFSNSMARTKTTPKKEREGRIVLRSSEEWAQLAREVRQEGERVRRSRRLARQVRKEKRPPSPVHYPSPAKRSSPMREVVQMLEEMVKWVEEAGWLEEVGQSLLSLPTRQLAQMAVEAGPSASGEEPAQRKLCPTIGARPHGRSS